MRRENTSAVSVSLKDITRLFDVNINYVRHHNIIIGQFLLRVAIVVLEHFRVLLKFQMQRKPTTAPTLFQAISLSF